MSGPRSYGRGAAVLSVGIGVTGLVTYTYFSLASHLLVRRRVRPHLALVVGGLRRRLGDLPPGRAAALAHDRRAARLSGTSSGSQRPSRLASRSCSRRRAALRGPIEDGLFGGSETLYWIFVATVIAYAASYFARGFLAGPPPLRGVRRCWSCSRPRAAASSRSPWPSGSARGRTRSRWAWSPRRSRASPSCRSPSRGSTVRVNTTQKLTSTEEPEFSLRTAPGSRRRCCS